MTRAQAEKIFNQYNPEADKVRCPNGRAKIRKQLDTYAQAAVNLYGIINRKEFVEIFNSQNNELITVDEIYAILLPIVLKHRMYGFYKDYIVHYIVLMNFDYVQYLEGEQSGKPRYIPPKKEFAEYEWEDYNNNGQWEKFRDYLFENTEHNENLFKAFEELKLITIHNMGIAGFAKVMQKYDIILKGQEETKTFIDLLMNAANNTRMWENKGFTPEELMKQSIKRGPQEMVASRPVKIGRNEPCPCGSGKKYKNCCALTETSGTAQLSQPERKFFYETWYKLLDYVNKKFGVIDMYINPEYQTEHDELKLFKIRDKLWKNPKIISEFVSNVKNLSAEEIDLVKSWQRRHIKDKFLLLAYRPFYAIFMQPRENEAARIFGVKGMTTSIAEAMHSELPIMLDTVLLPFKDKIIYDSFLVPYTVTFGNNIRENLYNEFEEVLTKNGITTELK